MFKVILFILFLCFSVNASENTSENIFTLGQIDVFDLSSMTASQERGDSLGDQETSKAHNRINAAQAASQLPGVVLTSSGARNERTVFVRGFDLRQVPFLIDGIPVYVPYDGYVDLGRFVTNDLSQIQVTKGLTSSLVGPNAFGGVINLVTQKPVKQFEVNGKLGATFDHQTKYNGSSIDLSLGGKKEKYYYILSGQNLDHDYTRASNKIPHSKNEDRKINLKAGYTPNVSDEYSLNYINQHGKKEIPSYAGNLSSIQKRYWKYPIWDKRSLYWISETKFENHSYLKTRAFYDVLKNTLESYDDATYSSMKKSYAFTSFYDDDSYGGNLELGHRFAQMTLKGAFHAKRDNHREHNKGEPVRTFSDETYSLGVENTYYVTKTLDFIAGASFDWRQSKKAQDYNSTTKIISDYPSNKDEAFNPQVGLIFRPDTRVTFHSSISKKTRIPTMKDRYSYRMGKALPNPALDPEINYTYELGGEGRFSDDTNINANLFYYDIRDTIQSVNLSANLTQMQNTGKSSTKGAELSFHHEWNGLWGSTLNYTFLEKRNRSQQTLYFTDSPKHTLSLDSPFNFGLKFKFTPRVEYSSMRYSDTTGTQRVAGFALAHLMAIYQVRDELSFDFGINNLFDKNYELTSGYPEEGRSYYINGRFKF